MLEPKKVISKKGCYPLGIQHLAICICVSNPVSVSLSTS